MKKGKRRYRLGQREERMAETRGRIVAAIVELHQEVGPRNTTIKGIAERAGVERLTVYRHFPDDRSLYEACSSCWMEGHPPPDPGQWAGDKDATRRTKAAFMELNGYYKEGSRMLRQIYRDAEEIPELAAVMEGLNAYLGEIRSDLVAAWRDGKGSVVSGLEQTIGHALDFRTWDSLEREGLDDEAKTQLELAWIRGVMER